MSFSKNKVGKVFFFTIMCTSTRFPQAIPLRIIKAKNIIKGFTNFFSFVGSPPSIQSGQDPNFMSCLFQQIMYKLGIEQYRSSAYHPELQGALERFHQSLKSMMKKFCYQYHKDWDDGIHLVLFADRESF